jgi:hypothetical protein
MAQYLTISPFNDDGVAAYENGTFEGNRLVAPMSLI